MRKLDSAELRGKKKRNRLFWFNDSIQSVVNEEKGKFEPNDDFKPNKGTGINTLLVKPKLQVYGCLAINSNQLRLSSPSCFV